MKKLLLLGALCTGLISCAKEESTSGLAGNQNPTSFDEMIINPNFDWETAHAVQLNVTGLKGGGDARHFLTVTDPSGLEVFKVLTSVGQSHRLKFELADQYNYVTVSFGTVQKQVEVRGRKAQFDYSIADDRSDLDPSDR
tara:strand:- start:132 stop:551 length:420 start_codon:yes stop_codon:yes gene_type:complete